MVQADASCLAGMDRNGNEMPERRKGHFAGRPGKLVSQKNRSTTTDRMEIVSSFRRRLRSNREVFVGVCENAMMDISDNNRRCGSNSRT